MPIIQVEEDHCGRYQCRRRTCKCDNICSLVPLSFGQSHSTVSSFVSVYLEVPFGKSLGHFKWLVLCCKNNKYLFIQRQRLVNAFSTFGRELCESNHLWELPCQRYHLALNKRDVALVGLSALSLC